MCENKLSGGGGGGCLVGWCLDELLALLNEVCVNFRYIFWIKNEKIEMQRQQLHCKTFA